MSEQDLRPAQPQRERVGSAAQQVPGLKGASGPQGLSGAGLGLGPHVNVTTTCRCSEVQNPGQEQEAALSHVTGSH